MAHLGTGVQVGGFHGDVFVGSEIPRAIKPLKKPGLVRVFRADDLGVFSRELLGGGNSNNFFIIHPEPWGR